MPDISLWTRTRWKLQQIHAEGIANWLVRWNSRPFVLTNKSTVVIAPHQDDEAIGCGGLIALKRERGAEVHIVFLTDGSSAPLPETSTASTDLSVIRKSEACAAAKVLGVDASCISFLDWPDSTLTVLNDSDTRRLITQLSDLLQKHQIEEIFVPHRRDRHPDHEAAYQLTRQAMLQSKRIMTVFLYSIWMLWSAPLFFKLHPRELAGAQRLSITAVQRKKQRAIEAHQSQCATLPGGFLDRFRSAPEIFFRDFSHPPDRPAADHRPRILFLDHTGSLGGAQLALLRLLRQLESGHRFHLHVLLFSDGPLRERIAASGIAVDVLPLSSVVLETSRYEIVRAILNLRSVGETLRYVLRLAEFLRVSKIDLVHTNTLKSNLIGGIAAVIAKKKVIWHVHDRIAGDYMPAVITKTFRYLARLLPSYVIANSETTHKLLFGNSSQPSSVIYPGIDIRSISGTTEELNPDRAVIGIVGRISPTKGHDVLLKAIPHVLQRFPGTQFRIIGNALFNDADYEKLVRTLTITLGIEARVRFTGFVDNVTAEMAALDILTVPSTVPESFGQVIVEGMAMEKPVIATGAGGALEIVISGETGILIPPGDPVKLAEAICSLLENPAGTRQMAQRGHESVVTRFTIERTGHEVEQVYRHLLGGTEIRQTGTAKQDKAGVHLRSTPTPGP